MTTLAPPSRSAAIASSRPVPQAEIQHHDVGAQDARSIERLAYARGLADDVEALRCLQNAPNAAPDELVVVDEDDGDQGDGDDTALRDIRDDGPCAHRSHARRAPASWARRERHITSSPAAGGSRGMMKTLIVVRAHGWACAC